MTEDVENSIRQRVEDGTPSAAGAQAAEGGAPAAGGTSVGGGAFSAGGTSTGGGAFSAGGTSTAAGTSSAGGGLSAGAASIQQRAAVIADERPEVAAGAAFAGGLLVALILKRIAR